MWNGLKEYYLDKLKDSVPNSGNLLLVQLGFNFETYYVGDIPDTTLFTFTYITKYSR